MTATERLKALLDKRGVEYEVRVENTTGIEHIIWHTDEFSQWDWNEEFGAGWLNGWQHDVTPEHAIAATLGPCNDSCNCTNDCTNDCTKLRELLLKSFELMHRGGLTTVAYGPCMELFEEAEDIGVIVPFMSELRIEADDD